MITHEGRTLFSESELRCRDSGLIILAPGFADRLRELRIELGRPMIVNSACRSAAHNRAVGGHPRSLHVCDEPHHPTGGCCAVDISTHVYDEHGDAWHERPDGYRGKLERLAWDLGWSIGYGRTFLHLDRRSDYTSLPQARFNY